MPGMRYVAGAAALSWDGSNSNSKSKKRKAGGGGEKNRIVSNAIQLAGEEEWSYTVLDDAGGLSRSGDQFVLGDVETYRRAIGRNNDDPEDVDQMFQNFVLDECGLDGSATDAEILHQLNVLALKPSGVLASSWKKKDGSIVEALVKAKSYAERKGMTRVVEQVEFVGQKLQQNFLQTAHLMDWMCYQGVYKNQETCFDVVLRQDLDLETWKRTLSAWKPDDIRKRFQVINNAKVHELKSSMHLLDAYVSAMSRLSSRKRKNVEGIEVGLINASEERKAKQKLNVMHVLLDEYSNERTRARREKRQKKEQREAAAARSQGIEKKRKRRAIAAKKKQKEKTLEASSSKPQKEIADYDPADVFKQKLKSARQASPSRSRKAAAPLFVPSMSASISATQKEKLDMLLGELMESHDVEGEDAPDSVITRFIKTSPEISDMLRNIVFRALGNCMVIDKDDNAKFHIRVSKRSKWRAKIIECIEMQAKRTVKLSKLEKMYKRLCEKVMKTNEWWLDKEGCKILMKMVKKHVIGNEHDLENKWLPHLHKAEHVLRALKKKTMKPRELLDMSVETLYGRKKEAPKKTSSVSSGVMQAYCMKCDSKLEERNKTTKKSISDVNYFYDFCDVSISFLDKGKKFYRK